LTFGLIVGFIDLSPVGDEYRKKGLAPAKDRINMCQLAVSMDERSFVMVDQVRAPFDVCNSNQVLTPLAVGRQAK
jgi:nicotinic acid mononucleotide adenylyltransferase